MAEAAQKFEVVEEKEVPFVRRFERPDIDKHCEWFIPRLLKTYPHLTERSVFTWLLNILTSNEFMFLYQDDAVALAQTVRYGLKSEAVVEEQFVWCREPRNADQQKAAAYFYDHFYEWAKRQALSTVVIEESTDVPHELIKEQLGKRLFERKMIYARVS